MLPSPLDNIEQDIPPHIRRQKIIDRLKEQFDFESSHLRTTFKKGEGILSKCYSYDAPDQVKDLGIYPFFREIEGMNGSHVTIDGRDFITITTNNYLDMTHDPRVIEGQVREKEEARATYVQARNEGRRASLVEQQRPNVFTASVAVPKLTRKPSPVSLRILGSAALARQDLNSSSCLSIKRV